MAIEQQTLRRIQSLVRLYQDGYRSNTVDATIDKLMAIERIRLEQEAASLTKRLAEFENLYNLWLPT